MTIKRSTRHSPPSHELKTKKGPYVIEFSIAGLPKMPNQLLGSHWWARSNHAKVWMKHVSVAIDLNGKRPKVPLKRAEIWCTRYSSGTCDDEGLRGSFKAPVDALKKLGVIEDDSPKHVYIHYTHEKVSPGKGAIRMRIEEREELA